MVRPADDGSPNEWQEIGGVLGKDRPALGRHQREEVCVAEPAQLGSFPSRHDIVPPLAELRGNSRRVVLIEEQPHSRMARSRRHAS